MPRLAGDAAMLVEMLRRTPVEKLLGVDHGAGVVGLPDGNPVMPVAH